jgi:hypothetical protein
MDNDHLVERAGRHSTSVNPADLGAYPSSLGSTSRLYRRVSPISGDGVNVRRIEPSIFQMLQVVELRCRYEPSSPDVQKRAMDIGRNPANDPLARFYSVECDVSFLLI